MHGDHRGSIAPKMLPIIPRFSEDDGSTGSGQTRAADRPGTARSGAFLLGGGRAHGPAKPAAVMHVRNDWTVTEPNKGSRNQFPALFGDGLEA